MTNYDQLPVHLKGELLAGLAQAAERLGEREDAKGYLKCIVDTMLAAAKQ